MELQSLPPTPKPREPLQIQRAVLVALVIRELRARVQGRWLGLIWMIAEPLAHVLGILVLYGFRRHAVSLNFELPVFLVTGLLPFFAFRNVARRLPGAIGGNRGLFAYRQVKPFDAMAARALVEVALYSAVYLTALVLLGWLGYETLPDAPLELIVASAVLLALGLGLGLVFAVASHRRPRVESMIGMLFFPLYFLSGVIFPVHTAPPSWHPWLLLNPVLHLIELSRAHFNTGYVPLSDVSLAYPAAWALVLMALGMSLYRLYRHEFITIE